MPRKVDTRTVEGRLQRRCSCCTFFRDVEKGYWKRDTRCIECRKQFQRSGSVRRQTSNRAQATPDVFDTASAKAALQLLGRCIGCGLGDFGLTLEALDVLEHA